MRAKRAKRERESERAGRARGMIGPFAYTRPDAWIYVWEAREERDRAYAWHLARVRPNAKPPWSESTGFPFWVECPPKRILGVKQHDNDGGDRARFREARKSIPDRL